MHRDLKPQNILLEVGSSPYTIANPEQITLKIADFGISRQLNNDSLAKTRCGTMCYMVGLYYFYINILCEHFTGTRNTKWNCIRSQVRLLGIGCHFVSNGCRTGAISTLSV
jgi:serine/threonine protein kinase